jgi:RimJ/RimL family protein N-acetyltransferase
MPLELVAYEPGFLEAFIEWRNQPLSIQHNPLDPLNSEQIARMLESEGSELTNLRGFATYRWFVRDRDELVGTVSLKNISHSMGYGEIGYGVAEPHHGRGIATAAVSLLIDKVFRETSLRKLIALVHVENAASRRVLIKLGFEAEGLLREHYVIDGHPVDEVLYGLLRRDWASAQVSTRIPEP